jgi:Na+/proline symporter
VYYISSGVLSACVAIPSIFIFWRRTTLPAVITAAVLGFVGTIGAFIYEYHYLQAADPNLPHYYTNDLPTWISQSYGYNYLVVGVGLSLVSIVVVSLLTRVPSAVQLAAVEAIPVEEYERFTAGAK